jgi:hypothetical protein
MDWARAIADVEGEAAPKITQTLTYEPLRHVDPDQRDTRPFVVLPSKSVVMLDRAIRRGWRCFSQAGGEGSHDLVT